MSTDNESEYYSEGDELVNRLTDEKKVNTSFAKLTLHPQKLTWIRHVVFYTQFPSAADLSKQQNYVLNIKIPKTK